jgi:hypothetical protein
VNLGRVAAPANLRRLLAATVPGFGPLPERRVALVGVRNTDSGEHARPDASAIAQIPAERIGGLAAQVGRIRDEEGATHASVHVALDVRGRRQRERARQAERRSSAPQPHDT